MLHIMHVIYLVNVFRLAPQAHTDCWRLHFPSKIREGKGREETIFGASCAGSQKA